MTDIIEAEKTNTIDGELEKNKRLTQITYGLYLSGFLFGFLPSLMALMINHMKKDDVKDSYLASHFRYQMRTAYFTILWAGLLSLSVFLYFVLDSFFSAAITISLLSIFNPLAFLIPLIVLPWTFYRLIKGFIVFNDGKAMYQ